MRLTCCCCGGEAPAREHWWNRDTGFGLCGRCATMIKARKDYDGIEFRRNYGDEGVHWFSEQDGRAAQVATLDVHAGEM